MDFEQTITKSEMRRVIRALGTKRTSHLVEIFYDIIEVYDDHKDYTLVEMLDKGRTDGYFTAIGMQKYESHIRPLFELAVICNDVSNIKTIKKLWSEVIAPANGFQKFADMFHGMPLPEEGYPPWRLRYIEKIKGER